MAVGRSVAVGGAWAEQGYRRSMGVGRAQSWAQHVHWWSVGVVEAWAWAEHGRGWSVGVGKGWAFVERGLEWSVGMSGACACEELRRIVGIGGALASAWGEHGRWRNVGVGGAWT